MEENEFLQSVAEDINNALSAGGYNEVEFFDEDLVKMFSVVGENINGEPRIARIFKPHSDKQVVIVVSYMDNDKYKVMVTLDKDLDFSEFDRTVGSLLKNLCGKWGSKLNYTIQEWGREIRNKDDIKRHVKKPEEDNTMTIKVDEAKVNMTGTTKSSYQKVGECKVIVRHIAKVNEEKRGARSRNIQAIFIETKGGERFRVSQNNLHGARAMARHLSNNGSPFDVVGNKITTMMNEMESLKKLNAEARKVKAGDSLVEKQKVITGMIREEYIKLRETLKKMSGKFGYGRQISMLEESKKDSGETTIKTETKTAKKKEEKDTVRFDQVPMYDRPDDERFEELTRDADNLFSINVSETDYGTTPEITMLEGWFNEQAKVEFFNNDELTLEEDAAPIIEKTLPENALHMLNMYQGHPLFNHYMKMYENQKIMKDVLVLVEEESKLWNSINEFANYGTDGMTMGRGEHPLSTEENPMNMDEALNKVRTLISDRRLSLDNAINMVADEIASMNEIDIEKDNIVEELWSIAEDTGLVKHDFGSTFSDEVLSSNDTIDAHKTEIEAEEFYGDATFNEEVGGDDIYEEMNRVRINAGLEPLAEEKESCSCDCGDDCNCDPDCDCGCKNLKEGDPFGRQSKRNLKNPKGRMSLINPEDKINHGIKSIREDDLEEDSKGCKYPMWDDKEKATHEYCDEPKKSGSSYCDKHHKSTHKGDKRDVDEAKAIPDWVKKREDNMVRHLDRKQSQDFEPRDEDEVKDKYSAMAKKHNVVGDEKPKKHVRGVRENDKYVEVDMPHHLPKTEQPTGEYELSEDGARIIQLARYKR